MALPSLASVSPFGTYGNNAFVETKSLFAASCFASQRQGQMGYTLYE